MAGCFKEDQVGSVRRGRVTTLIWPTGAGPGGKADCRGRRHAENGRGEKRKEKGGEGSCARRA